MPVPQLVRCQCTDLDGPKLGSDEGAISIARVVARLAVGIEEIEVSIHRIGDGKRTVFARRSVCPTHHALARLVLRLLEIQDRHAVRVGEVVSRRNSLDHIGLTACVVTHHPFSGHSGLALASSRLPVA